MYTEVRYRNEKTGGSGERAYMYKTSLPLEIGDLVIAPTYKGGAAAIVSRTNIPETEVDKRYIRRLREITDYYEAGEDAQ